MRRDDRTQKTNPDERGGDPREERLQALFTAADPPLQPSEALRRRVREITSRADTQASRRNRWPLLPMLLRPAALLAAAVGPLVDAAQGGLDFLQELVRVLQQTQR